MSKILCHFKTPLYKYNFFFYYTLFISFFNINFLYFLFVFYNTITIFRIILFKKSKFFNIFCKIKNCHKLIK
ncbi:hypothetical protein C4N17_08145 [Fusobacterium periodonticum]|uniref:Uncharacterized protein n=1 Tax=Fusobacterium periodonticum TaxID=860 RepID=A0AAD0HWT3_9FUSO|nr:hypothetical protein C4N17_08145 [Fusobacterium periodonticum]